LSSPKVLTPGSTLRQPHRTTVRLIITFLSGVGLAGAQARSGAAGAWLERLSEHVGVWRDGEVNVGVIERGGYALLVESGRGLVAGNLSAAGIKKIEWCLYTDHHRDLVEGAADLRRSGVRIAVPASETRFFRDAAPFWQKADMLLDHAYNFRPDLFVLRASVPVDRELRAGDSFDWRGLRFAVLETPGDSDGGASFLVHIDGKTFAFTGDLIAGPGQLYNLYRFQKRFPGMPRDYWGFGGAVADDLASLEKILARHPHILIGSHGQVMRDPRSAVDLLRRRLDAVMRNYSRTCSWRVYHAQHHPFFPYDMPEEFSDPLLPPLPGVQLPAWIHHLVDTTSYIRADDGSAFVFDCGSERALKALDQLAASGRISSVEGIWVSHYHDDHTGAVNDLRRRPYAARARVYAQQEMRDILEHPRAYKMPCLYPEGLRVDHPLAEGEMFDWKGFRMTAYYFPGQTLYHDGLVISREGVQVFLSGDSLANWGIDDYCSYNRNFIGRDGALAGFERCLDLLERLKPSLLVAAHWGALPVSPAYVRATRKLLQDRARLLQPLFPWDDPNFGLDPEWVRTYPYRQTAKPGRTAALEVKIYNHSDSDRRAFVAIAAPAGWRATAAPGATVAAHSEGTLRFTLSLPAGARGRSVLGVNVRFGGRDLGEFAEAIVDCPR
jgi:glyoxylase-like metal-dependent hydrolase (beta-lactamase superfamily II)